jgi:putative endonuclease
MSWFKARPSESDPGKTPSTTERGNAAELRAQRHLEARGLVLVARHYRIARGPSRPAGEVDLIMREGDGTLVFVEVRARRSSSHGGAAASVNSVKQGRIQRAAEHYLRKLKQLPPCRFDVVAIDGEAIEWLQAAFDAS